MTTVLLPLSEPYASVRVAVYEPFVTFWSSVPVVDQILTSILERAVARRKADVPGGAASPSLSRFAWTTPDSRAVVAPRDGELIPVARAGAGARHLVLEDEELKRRAEAINRLRFSATLSPEALTAALDSAGLPHLLGGRALGTILSPIGVTHLYRQLYFDAGAGIGPIEHAFTLAPLEQMEVIQEVTRRESIERTEIFGREETLEKSAEETTTDEITDQVQSSMRRDLGVGLSASAGGTIGVWNASAQVSANLAQSTERSRETATTRSTTETKKASEILRKTYSVTVKTYTELNERSSVKRVVRNESPVPVNYGLRRVMRTIRVKLQSLGPRLVWQTYVRAPGRNLALSEMVLFREADATANGVAPNAPPRPVGGTETRSAQVQTIRNEGIGRYFELVVPVDPLRTHTLVTITSVTNPLPDENPAPPSVTSTVGTGAPVLGPGGQTVAIAYRFDVSGEGWTLDVEYALTYEPSALALEQWQQQVQAAQAAWDAQRADEAFERARRTITAKSRIRPRPSADLRDEERYELLNRFLTTSFGGLLPGIAPSSVEVEVLHRYFEIPSLFYWVHPSWWLPRAGTGRDPYDVTEDSEPAPFGRSLGWLIQLDGDRRRNEFLNSPWVRVCVPMRPGMEGEALQWLAQHVEGTRGFDTTSGSQLAAMLEALSTRRDDEARAAPGPDYVTLDGQIPIGREASADAYPVIDEFNVTVPTEGFIYDVLTTSP